MNQSWIYTPEIWYTHNLPWQTSVYFFNSFRSKFRKYWIFWSYTKDTETKAVTFCDTGILGEELLKRVDSICPLLQIDSLYIPVSNVHCIKEKVSEQAQIKEIRQLVKIVATFWMAVVQLLTFLQIYVLVDWAERLTTKRYKYLWGPSSPFMHWLLFGCTPSADKRGACSLLAQIPEATPPLLQPQLPGNKDRLSHKVPQRQLAQSPFAHPTRQ